MKKSNIIITKAKKELARERDSETLERVKNILVQIEETEGVLVALKEQLADIAK